MSSPVARPRRAVATRKAPVVVLETSDDESDLSMVQSPQKRPVSKKSKQDDDSYSPEKTRQRNKGRTNTRLVDSDLENSPVAVKKRSSVRRTKRLVDSDLENSPIAVNKRSPVKRTKRLVDSDLENSPVAVNKRSPVKRTNRLVDSDLENSPVAVNKTSPVRRTKAVAANKATTSPKTNAEKKRPTKRVAPAKTSAKKDSVDAVNNDDESEPSKKKRIVSKSDDIPDGACLSAAKEKTSSTKRISKRFEVPSKSWTEPELLAQLQNLDYTTAKNIIELFDDDNQIPFICRYRKEAIGNLSPDELRDIKITYNHVVNVKTKAATIIKNLEKEDVLTDQIRGQIECAKSLDELDHLYAPYKPTSKASLFERAKTLGLLEPAESLLFGDIPCPAPLTHYIDLEIEGLESLDKIEKGIKHIASHIISKDTKVLEELRRLQDRHCIYLQSKPDLGNKTDTKASSRKKDEKPLGKPVDPSKFETYFEFNTPIKYVKPHQTLAINRGESLNVLAVKVDVPNSLRNDLYRFARNEFLNEGFMSRERVQMFDQSFEEAYSKKLQPLLCRQVRNELTKIAQAASIEVFATNLKQLLLMSPVKGECILGIDPGFTNGCKLALVSECMEVLDTDVIYPHTSSGRKFEFGRRVAKMMQKHGCKLIALGNGTACRETEQWIASMFEEKILNPEKVKYSIVTEQGASIYSCGDIAKKEFPDLDVNLISAVSIARRLGDPLGEFVKVEPKHLGVGMYQHDVNEKLLSESLNEVVMECVSFVGVDINTASEALLRHVAGLTSVRAANIVKYRTEHGPFKSREQLKKVKQIGEKTFVQCAGFVRIEPLTAGTEKYNRLDSTWVHPESYDLVKRIFRLCGSWIDKIGTPECIATVKAFAALNSAEKLSSSLPGDIPAERIQSVLDALQRELFKDYRADINKRPLFKQGLDRMANLREGTVVSGAITNKVPFGYFVDIGVEKDGLIHVSKLGGMMPNIGDRVEASVILVDTARARIQLKLLSIS